MLDANKLSGILYQDRQALSSCSLQLEINTHLLIDPYLNVRE